jgi:hypothetical protein
MDRAVVSDVGDAQQEERRTHQPEKDSIQFQTVDPILSYQSRSGIVPAPSLNQLNSQVLPSGDRPRTNLSGRRGDRSVPLFAPSS